MTAPVLALRDLQVRFPVGTDWLGRPRQHVHALNGIDLDIRQGETLGVVGESGCGKTTLAQVLIGLVQPSAGSVARRRPDGGETRMQIVFQDPQSSLNPRLPVWRIIAEPLTCMGSLPLAPLAPGPPWTPTIGPGGARPDRPHVERGGRLGRDELRRAAAAAAAQVEIPADYLDRFPHEFSGGQRQRIAIARALITGPDVILLDEPTSALDISVQAQILNLLNDLQKGQGLTFILISHNVAVVRHMSDRVAVMYLGQVVELGPADQVLGAPRHPYTQVLLDSVPRLGVPVAEGAASSSTELPSNRNLPEGCFFRDRCPRAGSGCKLPQGLRDLAGAPGHAVRCLMAHD
jgi:peptide/nickel transport system ATP-binding protein